MGKRLLGFVCIVAFAGTSCDSEYSFAPTPCDDYCLATQRADCADDWPDDCVSYCELTRSPTNHPACSGDFYALLDCYQNADDGDFFCADDESEPRRGVCEAENRAMDYCIEPVYNRCTELCRSKHERCSDFEWTECQSGCQIPIPACEDAAVAYYDCELENDASCGPSPLCALLQAGYADCLGL